MNHLEKHEVLAVLKVAREHSELDWLLFAFQYIHSHRISEVLALTLKTSMVDSSPCKD